MAIKNTKISPLLKEGTNITLTQNGQVITIAATDTTNAPGGTSGQVQFNDSGAFGGDAGLTYNKTTNVLGVESIDFATTPTAADAERRLHWDNDEGSLVLTLKGGNLTIPIGQEVATLVYNAEATTLTKGTVVYVFGASGQRISVKRAVNTSDATSAQTLGVVAESIASGAEGFVMVQGMVRGIDTSAYVQGDTLYLSATAGLFTKTKPVAPNHLVYVGFVVKVNASSGEIFVRPQNGYEMNELHNYLEGSVQNNDVISYESSTSLYKPKSIPTLLGYTPLNPTRNLTINNTTYDLSADRTWSVGTVTSVGGTGTVNGITLTGSITSSGNLTLGGTLSGVSLTTQVTGTLPIANGGTGLTALGTAGQLLKVNSGATALEYFTPTYISGNQTITLSGDVSGSGTTAITTTIGAGKVTNTMLVNSSITIQGTSTALGGSVDVINGTGFVKANGTTITYDNSTYYLNSNPNGYTSNTGTVTSVAALTLGTSGTDLSSTVANGTTTPVITLNVPTASATNRGALSSADWTTFNNKFTLPSFTSGSVLFSNGTTIAQDNANFFWDDTNNRLGIGTASPSLPLQVNSSAGAFPATTGTTQTGGVIRARASNSTAVLDIGTNGGSGAWIQSTDSIGLNTNFALLLNPNGGNVGIGTTSPSFDFSIEKGESTAYASSSASVVTPAGGVNAFIRNSTNAGFASLRFQALDSSNAIGYIGFVNTTGSVGGSFVIGQRTGTSSYAEQMRLDSSGNLGLGVTPSAWSSGRVALQIGGTPYIVGTNIDIGSNFYVDGGGYKYLTTAVASRYDQNAGSHRWFTATSGSINTAISFTQAMTLTAGGNLGLGTASPNLSGGSSGSSILTISATSSGRNGVLELNGTRTTSGDYVGYVRFFNNAAATPVADIQVIRGSSDTTGDLAFATGNSERMRIFASGNVFIGSSPSDAGYKLDVNGTGRFSGNLTVRTSGGNSLDFGRTDQSTIQLYQDGTNYGFYNTGTSVSNFIINNSSGAATFSSSVELSNGGLFISAGSGTNYSTRLSTVYTFPYVDTYLDSYAGASYEGRLQFRTNSGGGSLSTKLTIANSGQLKLNAYTSSSSFTGTAQGYLAFTSTGEIITKPDPTSGAVTGSGTEDYLVKFTSTGSAVGNSNILTRGTDVTWFNTYKGANSDGYNIFIGNSGTSSIGAVGQTFKGSYNASLGHATLFDNTNGYYNVAVGAYSLKDNTTGYNNVGIGSSSLGLITTGHHNIAIGTDSGQLTNASASNLTSTYSVYLGDDSRPSADGNTNEIVIGYAARGNGSNTITLGNSSIGATYLTGGQLAFPATANLSTNGNTLDDYEEGSFDPTYEASAGTFTTRTYNSARSGRYQKIGNKVYITGRLSTDNIVLGTATAVLRIGGLPFAASSTSSAEQSFIVCNYVAAWTGNPPSTAISALSDSLSLYAQRDTLTAESTTIAPSDLTTGSVTNANLVHFFGVYTTNL